MALRMFDDKAVLRTDWSVDWPVMWSNAERVFDPASNYTPTTLPVNPGTEQFSHSGLNNVKTVFHQIRQMETAFVNWDDPSLMVASAYSDPSLLV